jgi:hypothetical protein
MPFDVLFQRYGVVVLSILGAKEQRDGALLGCLRELLDLPTMVIQFRSVSPFEFFPSFRGVSEPFPQLGAWRDFLKPLIDSRFSFR